MEDHPKGWITHEGLVVNGRKGMYHELLPHPATADATDAAGGDAAGGDAAGGGGAGALGEGGQSSQVEQEGAGEGVDDDETAAAAGGEEDSVRTHICFFAIERQTKTSSKHEFDNYRFLCGLELQVVGASKKKKKKNKKPKTVILPGGAIASAAAAAGGGTDLLVRNPFYVCPNV